MSEYYTLVQEGLDQWINSPDNGGECCQTSRETVDELNRLINRIKRLEEALEGTVKLIVHLADSGDVGFWNPEEQLEIIEARAALQAKEDKP